ncbi:hypothetical protein [Streptomyces spiramenti]|uniref:DUF3558 domain-containing protein n=1 Tax=Streptomyces spiramenti TaxID=2720606 RepID=A0ABX1AK11_9ACTN|nr:hypothetical protein [Streptomyces spiramenti]NJP66006.1 hypothetical protein [Streptomyces spiramenti]
MDEPRTSEAPEPSSRGKARTTVTARHQRPAPARTAGTTSPPSWTTTAGPVTERTRDRRGLRPRLLAPFAAAAAVSAVLVLTACGSEGEEASAATAPGVTAETLANDLAAVTEMPNPRDTTHSCDSEDIGDHACEQMISTDTLSVYQLAGGESAEHWADTIGQTHTVAVVGAFLLKWQYTPAPDDFNAVVERAEEVVG